MVKKLTKHGNSLALVIDKALLNVLKISEDTELQLIIEDGDLIIRPLNKKSATLKDKDLDKIAEKIMDKYENVFKKLAK